MPLRLAVAGLGHGASYLNVIADHPRTELAALIDINAEPRDALARTHKVPAFASVQAMLAANVADAAILALPTPLHRETSVACLEAGLHVLQEKPLCLKDEEAQAIREAVCAANRVFQVGYEVRSSPLHKAVLEHIARGDLGQLTNIWYNQHSMQHADPGNWRAMRTSMGGKLFDCAVHYLDLCQQWAGAPVHRIVALGHELGKIGPCADELPESAAIAIEYANGVRCTFNFGGRHGVRDDASFGLIGTRGRIVGNPWLPEGAGSYELRLDNGLRHGTISFDGTMTSRGHLGFREQLAAFVATVLDGAPNACDIDDAIAIHRQMVAIDRSLATGRVIDIHH